MKLSTYEITRQIADLLPEPMWSEVFRRLRFAPETWHELSDTDTLHAWLQRPAALQIASWQPLLFQLWLYSRTNPAAGNDAAQWLQNTDAGNAAINEALQFLLSASSGKQFDAQTALLASFALAQKLASGSAGPSLEAACSAPEIWRSVFTFTYANQDAAAALVDQCGSNDNGQLAALIVHAALANSTPASAAQQLSEAVHPETHPGFLLAIAKEIAAHGYKDLGAAVLHASQSIQTQTISEPAIAATRQLAKDLERSALQQFGETTIYAEHIQTATKAAENLYRDLVLDLGLRQVVSNPESAIKHLEAARSHGAEPAAWLAPLAAAHIAIGQPLLAKQLLLSSPTPTARELVVSARLHLLDGDRAAALSCAGKALDLSTDIGCATDVGALAASACSPELSARAAQRLLELEPSRAARHLISLAEALIASRFIEQAREAAFMGLAADPANLEARAFYARTLASTAPGTPANHAAALDHWQRITQASPLNLNYQASFARCALEGGKFELAISIAQRALALPAATDEPHGSSGRAEVQIVIGEAFAASGSVTEAQAQLVAATETAPTLPSTWQALALHHAHNNELPQALTIVEQGLKTVSAAESAELWLELARLRVEYGQPQLALEALAKADQQLPYAARVQHLLGTLQFNLGLGAEAISTLGKATTLDANNPQIYFDLARAQDETEPALALASYQRALDSGISEPTIHARIGQIAQRLGNNTLARTALQQAYSDGDNAIDTILALGTTLEKDEDWAAARAIYHTGLQGNANNSQLITRLGKSCLALGQPAAAIAVLAPAAEHNLDDAALQAAIGAAYAATGLWDEALLSFEQALRSAPNDSGVLQQAAAAAAAAHHYPQAIDLLKLAIQLEPQNAKLQSLLGDCLSAAGQKAAAHTEYLRAAELAPNDAAQLVLLGDSWLGTGSQTLALAAYERAALAAPNAPEILLVLAEAHLNNANPTAALESFHQAAAACDTGVHAALHAKCLRGIAEAWTALGDDARALEAWTTASEKFPLDAALHSELGNALMHMGNAAASQAAHAAAAQLERSQASHLLAAAHAALAAGNSTASNTFAQQAGSLPLERPDELGQLGRLHHQLGDAQKALAFHHRACVAAGDDPASRATLALALADAGEFAECATTASSLLALPDLAPAVRLKTAGAMLRSGYMNDALSAYETLTSNIDTDGAYLLHAAADMVAHLESAHDECCGLHPMEQPDVTELTALAERAINRAQVLGADSNQTHAVLGRLQSASADYINAITNLKRELQTRYSPEVACALAHAQLATGADQAAVELLHQVLSTTTNHARALMLLARCAADVGETAGTAEQILAAAAHPAHNALAHFRIALAQMTLADGAGCIAQLDQALRLAPEHAGWHFHLAVQQEMFGETQAALAHYQQAVHLGRQQQLPARRLAAFTARLAAAAHTDGDLVTARREYLNAINLQPDIAAWWVASGSAALGLQDAAAAAQDFEKASTLEPNTAAPHVGRMHAMLALGDLAEAERHALTAIKLAPANEEALVALGSLFAARGAHANALQTLDQALGYNPQSAPIQIAKARVLAQTGRQAAALDLLKPHLAGDCNAAEVWAFAGELYAGTEQLPESIAAYEHATEIQPLAFAHQLRLGQLCRIGGQPDKAITNLERAQFLATAGPEQAAVLTEAGLVFEARRQYDRAYKSFTEAIECAPQQPDNYFRAGLALKGLKDYSEALTMFQKAVTLDPKHREAHRQLATVSALGLMSGVPT